jgi:hypothetical protein
MQILRTLAASMQALAVDRPPGTVRAEKDQAALKISENGLNERKNVEAN